MGDREIYQLLLSPRFFFTTESWERLCSRRLCLWKQTSLVQERSPLPTAVFVTTRKMVALLVVPLRSQRWVQVSVCWNRPSHSCDLR